MRYVLLFFFTLQCYANSLDNIFENVSVKYDLPPGLLKAVCKKETRLKNVVNWKDGNSPSYSYCQVKMSTAQHMGFKNTIPHLNLAKHNIDVAGKYLAYLYKKCGDWISAISAYNTGRCLKNPLTQYSKDVILKWEDILNERN